MHSQKKQCHLIYDERELPNRLNDLWYMRSLKMFCTVLNQTEKYKPMIAKNDTRCK